MVFVQIDGVMGRGEEREKAAINITSDQVSCQTKEAQVYAITIGGHKEFSCNVSF